MGIARAAFALPYYRARMTIARQGDRIAYEGERGRESYALGASIEGSVPTPVPGSLEFFLVERYLLYAFRGDRLLGGRVHHAPYELRGVCAEPEEQTLVRAAGIAPRPFVHRAFSEGVDVDIYPLRPVR